MKHLRLSPFTRQLIIFLLLMALLWQTQPLIEADGRMRIEFTDFPRGSKSPEFVAGGYVNIVQTLRDQQTGISRTWFLLAGIPLASATWKDPNSAYLFLDKHFSLGRIVPKRLRLDGGWILVLRMTPEQYATLQTAREQGSIFDCSVGKQEDHKFILKKPKTE